MNNPISTFFAIAISVIYTVISPVKSDEQDLIALINRLNSDILELRNEIETSWSKRCDTVVGCHKASYDECQSEMTSAQTCPNLEQLGYAIPECGQGEICNGLFDYELTTVRLPQVLTTGPNKNPTDPTVVEEVCASHSAQKWMVEKYAEINSEWRSLGVDSPPMYFGSSSGVFRIFPARQSRQCGQYDPRERPWYKEAVPSTISKLEPRQVVIILDTSRSMDDPMSDNPDLTKLSYTKSVVTSTLRLLTEQDSVAVIKFNEYAHILGRLQALPPYHWQSATDSHVQRLIDEVNALEANGRSNWINAFDYAFTLIDNSLEEINSIGTDACKVENIALLFFSDGEMNVPADVTDEEITQFVSDRVKAAEETGDVNLYSFLYSVSNADPLQVTKQISCAAHGIWKPLTASMSAANATDGYETLFSTPMGTEYFYNFTTWSNPYIFTTSEEKGYTVSALVYNREVEPPRFIGAVGMDVLESAAQRVYGGTSEETEQVIKRITADLHQSMFNVTCSQKSINLSACELQSLRYFSGGEQSVCISQNQLDSFNESSNTRLINSSNAISYLQQLNCSKAFVFPCAGTDEYPRDLWNNVNLQGLTYEERVCCKVGSNTVSDECPYLDEVSTHLSKGVIFAIFFLSLSLIEILGCYFCFFYKKNKETEEE